MTPPRIAAAAALVLLALTAPATAPPALAGRRGDPQFGEVKPDKALVYFIRTARFGGSARTQYVYADDTFLGVLRSGSYSFSYVAPGRHLFWTNWTKVTREIDLAPGETYYLDIWMTIAVVEEARGKELIEQVGDFVSPAPDDFETAKSQIEHRYERAKRKEGEKEKADVPVVEAASTPPVNVEGMLKVPANSIVSLDLLENVCSGLSTNGDTVWFRVAEDASVDGAVFLSKGRLVKGVVRQSEAATGMGKEGVLEVVVPSLPAEDGSAVPTIGQIASSGQERTGAATGAAAGFGLFGAAMVKGREAYHLAGERFVVHTRQDAWIRPGAPSSGPAAAAAASGGLVLKGTARDPIKFNPRKGKISDTIEIDLDAQKEPRDVAAFRFGEWEVPEPVKATMIERHGKAWRCTFTGWGVTRYLQQGAGDTTVPIKMRGALEDGTSFIAEANVVLSVDKD